MAPPSQASYGSDQQLAQLYARWQARTATSILSVTCNHLSDAVTVKHAGPLALDALNDLLDAVRTHAGLREPRRGVFYRKGKAWLHFHEDRAGLFADLRIGADWQRFPVSDPAGCASLLAAIDRSL